MIELESVNGRICSRGYDTGKTDVARVYVDALLDSALGARRGGGK